jgi:DNA-binding response OmpR family regulator/anti-anti-sigma regulatory factor
MANEPLILIVDDNPANLDVLCNLVMGAGFEVAVATDGGTAIGLAEREPPALVLLDIELPGIDGFETLRRLKESPTTRDIPVIFMTARIDSASKLRGLRAGAVDYVVKPFEAEEILARVKVHVELRALHRTLADSHAHLLRENRERAAAQAALTDLTRELEQRVEGRTAELARALRELKEAQTELRKANEALEQEAEARTSELVDVKEQLESELVERERSEQTRLALQDEIIAVQRASLAELSTPLIPITDTTMIMPMIGTMSEERAQQMLETALSGVHTHGAQVVLIDVTGLKLVDTRVASMLVRTADALRLLGARAVLTGIRPELAQALIGLDFDLGDIVIRGTLKGGIAYALGRSRARGSGGSARRGASRGARRT